MSTEIVIKSPDELKVFLHKNYLAQIKNFFGDEKQAMKFMSSVMASVQRVPELLTCEPMTVINSFITMAELALMPSDVSGEAYVLPYNNSKNIDGKWVKVMEAQFQLGYQGCVTLFYRAGVEAIRSEIVREHDEFSYENGIIRHKIDIFKSRKARGEAIGAYAIGVFRGHEVAKVMNREDILEHAKTFSKSFSSKHTPWQETKDPELWMWKKTALKQLGKLLPKNETIAQAIAYDNEDSRGGKAIEGLVETSNLKMGNLLKKEDEHDQTSTESSAPEAPVAGGESA